jgi:ArsR family transcriptional regulator, zinc-responsive transcriptional repressor
MFFSECDVTKQRSVESLCRLFRVLSDETRLKLLVSLQEGEQHVTELCRKLRLPQPTVSHHLGLLRVNGLVKNRRKGKLVFYSLEGGEFARVLKEVESLLS